jgi:hypothetical protein
MADGKGRGDVKAMIVRGIILKTLFSIPMTYIPLTLVNSRKITGRRSRAKTTQAPILVFFAFLCGKNLVGIAGFFTFVARMTRMRVGTPRRGVQGPDGFPIRNRDPNL